MTNKQILFIDANVSDKQTLINGVAPDVKVVLLNDKINAITQIATALDGQKNLDALHIISHGSSGELEFATGALNNQNVSTYASQLKKIGQSLSSNGDILLYGCDVAKGDAGLAFINQLSTFTNADVAASNDLTGFGGNWILEANTGAIEANSAITLRTQSIYNESLALITGTTGNDSLTSGNGNDTLDGGLGNDSLYGGLGNDMLIDALGNDTLYGGDGNDTVDYSAVTSWALNITLRDSTKSYTVNAGNLGTDTLWSIENLIGSWGDDNLTGNSSANSLTGGLGSDELDGGSGNDTLAGGDGTDYLTGGTGNDTFKFTLDSDTSITSYDVIYDFASGSDKIDLSSIDANSSTTGDQAFSSTILTTGSAFTAAGQLRFDSADEMLYGNIDSDTDAEFSIYLSAVTSVTASNFTL